jgi:hypothetical protein
VRPLSDLATRFGRDGRGTNAITKFGQCLSQEPRSGGASASARARAISKVSIAAARTPALRSAASQIAVRLAIMVLTWFKPLDQLQLRRRLFDQPQ